MTLSLLDVRPEVAGAVRAGRPVVALESTLIAHGLPWPRNLETARAAEEAVRAEGATPATVAVWQGRPTVGLSESEIEHLARSPDVRKASTRDLAAAVSQKAHAATTVAATMHLAHLAGIRLFATGGIGGVHPASVVGGWRLVVGDNPSPPTTNRHPPPTSRDVSADLPELARTAVAVVCAGAKNILDLEATLELLETLGVPVVGYGTSEFPAFYLHSSGRPVSARVETPAEAAALLEAHWGLGGAGVVLAQPLPSEQALEPTAFADSLMRAEELSRQAGIHGPARTPFLLARLAELTDGRTLRANQALVVANARLAARVARSLAERA